MKKVYSGESDFDIDVFTYFKYDEYIGKTDHEIILDKIQETCQFIETMLFEHGADTDNIHFVLVINDNSVGATTTAPI